MKYTHHFIVIIIIDLLMLLWDSLRFTLKLILTCWSYLLSPLPAVMSRCTKDGWDQNEGAYTFNKLLNIGLINVQMFGLLWLLTGYLVTNQFTDYLYVIISCWICPSTKCSSCCLLTWFVFLHLHPTYSEKRTLHKWHILAGRDFNFMFQHQHFPDISLHYNIYQS